MQAVSAKIKMNRGVVKFVKKNTFFKKRTQIVKIEPYGRWTYVVKFKDTNETALMTAQNYEKIKNMFA